MRRRWLTCGPRAWTSTRILTADQLFTNEFIDENISFGF